MADRHVAAVLLAAGASDVTLPTYQERRELFDAALVAGPESVADVDSDQMELRRVLGVA